MGKRYWEGSGRPQHTHAHIHRPTLLPQEEIINLLGIKSAASQKLIVPKCRRKASCPPREQPCRLRTKRRARHQGVRPGTTSPRRDETRPRLCPRSPRHGTRGALTQRPLLASPTVVGGRGRGPLPESPLSVSVVTAVAQMPLPCLFSPCLRRAGGQSLPPSGSPAPARGIQGSAA